jgi:hypothetical protein
VDTVFEIHRKLAGKNMVKPNGKPTVTGRMSSLIRCRPSRFVSRSPRLRNSWAGGMDSKPRTSTRNHRLMMGPTSFFACAVKAGSHLASSEASSSLSLMMLPTSQGLSPAHSCPDRVTTVSSGEFVLSSTVSSP